MRTFCTLSDNNYLLKGLTLYHSLKEHEEDFKLHYLCIDDTIYDKLISLNIDDIIPYKLSDLMKYDGKLSKTKENMKYSDFCFSLASYFSNYILRNNKQNVYYLDSDLFFYRDLDIIEEEINGKSIGIIRHRHVERGHYVGEYNVGLVYFKYNDIGIGCSNQWWEWVINPTNKHYKEYGTCGDQKYLELFDIYYNGNISVIENNSSQVAPYNFDRVDWSPFTKTNRKVIYKGKKHDLTFCHFMQFKPKPNGYDATGEPNNQKFLNIDSVKFLYDEYYNKTMEIKNKYQL
jgi:hypothetical protein